MIEFMDRTDGKTVGIHVSGEVQADDFRAMASLMREQIDAQGKLRLVLKIESVNPVSPAVLWEEFKLAFDHFEDFERVALVGDELWQEAFVKVLGPLMPADFRHFSLERHDDAWRWVG